MNEVRRRLKDVLATKDGDTASQLTEPVNVSEQSMEVAGESKIASAVGSGNPSLLSRFRSADPQHRRSLFRC